MENGADNNVLNATILADNGPSQPSSSAKHMKFQHGTPKNIIVITFAFLSVQKNSLKGVHIQVSMLP